MTEVDPQHPLAGIAAKIDRADFHLKTLEEKIRRFADGKLYSFTIEVDKESSWHSVTIHIHRPMPLLWGAIVGDIVHNLRSALDHLIWQIVRGRGNIPGKWNEFPLYDSRSEFERKVERPFLAGKRSALRGVSHQTFARIEILQPYHAPDSSRHGLGILHALSNTDKHRLVHSSYVRIPEQASKVGGEGWIISQIDQPVGVVEDGAEVLRYRAWFDRPDSEVDVKVDIPLDVAFGDLHIPRRQLKDLRNSVVGVINLFSPGFS
jgi:hypothetical protein